MGNFDFVHTVFPDAHADCAKAESYVQSDPVTCCAYARRAINVLVPHLYYDVLGLRTPSSGDDLFDLLKADGFTRKVDRNILGKLHFIRKIGNHALHDKRPDVNAGTSLAVMNELFHVLVWTGYHMSDHPEAVPLDTQFDPTLAKRARALNAAEAATLLKRTQGRFNEQRRIIEEREQRIKEQSEELDRREQDIARRDEAIARKDEALASKDAELARYREQTEALRAQIKAAQARNTREDTHDYTYGEAETRAALIDDLLAEEGWNLTERNREVKVEGMPPTPDQPTGIGYADYVLWDDDGMPLAVIEAKRTSVSVAAGEQQALRYADALDLRYNPTHDPDKRPVIFLTNGYETRIWDEWRAADGTEGGCPQRVVQGFYAKDELKRLLARRAAARLSGREISPDIAGRPYQQEAIQAVDAAFDGRRRAALLVMATGTGKTRVAIALVQQLMRAGWVRNVLFLADRTALVNQAAKAFRHRVNGLGDRVPVVNLLEDRNASGRVYLSTYPTMMNLVNARGGDGMRRFGPGFFDLVIIDEAHRSVYAKYGFLFDYFDALLVGLTATPKNEVDRNTYRLFGLDYDARTGGVPTYAYGLEQAVREGHLVPARSVSIGTRIMDRGIRYDELTPEQQAEWESKDWDEDGDIPDRVDASDVNRKLFNADTIDKVLGVLMERGIHVDDGERLGKTIIFARNQRHAEEIKARFDMNWPELGGTFARVITHATRGAQSLIEDFEDPDKDPMIAISVDMLDTGVDVPEVVNLVFFKPVMSRTKYWQMIGRGTRPRPDLFGPGRDKTEFLVIDCCDNVAYFNENIPERDVPVQPSLGERLFRLRLGLLETLDRAGGAVASDASGSSVASVASDAADDDTAFGGGRSDRTQYRAELARTLDGIVSGMRPDENVLVRPHRRDVENVTRHGWWDTVTPDKARLAATLAGLPSANPDGDAQETGADAGSGVDAKHLDLLVYTYELALLRAAQPDTSGESGQPTTPDYGVASPRMSPAAAQRGIRDIAEQLRDPKKRVNPDVAAAADLLDMIVDDDWWRDVTIPMLETARKQLRGIARYATGVQRNVVYTDFEDELTYDESGVVVPGGDVAAVDMERFRARATEFLHGLNGDITLARVRMGRQLTPQDLERLERILVDNGVGDADDVAAAADATEGGFGMFVRSLVGLDRAAVEAAFSRFLDGKRYNARQIAFVRLIVDELTANGSMGADRLYDPPFSDVAGGGPEALFPDEHDVDGICDIINGMRDSAIPRRKAA